MHILFIDDDEIVNFTNQSLVKIVDPSIKTFSILNPEKAFTYLDQNQPDIIFLDINMSWMTGWEFLDYYSKRYRNRSTEIIMLTTSLYRRDRIKARKHELVSGFYSKPLKINIVKEVLQQCKVEVLD